MYKKAHQHSLDNNQRQYILDLIESIERWDNALHRNLAMDKRESLMVIQSRELRDEQFAFLYNYLMESTSAIVAIKDYSNYSASESPRYNRAALVSTLELIHKFDLTIKELELNFKSMKDNLLINDYNNEQELESLAATLELHQKQRNNQWFFMFDYLCELGGKNFFPTPIGNYQYAMAS